MARRGHAKKIDTVHWTGFSGSVLGLATGGTSGQTLLAAQHLPETTLRIRGEWACNLDGPIADGVAAIVTAGIILVPEGTGTTVLWSPSTDSDAPWMWWDCFNLLYDEVVTDVIAANGAGGARRVIDSKAMRKVRQREHQLVVESVAVNGTPASNMAVCGRILSGS